TCRRTWDLLLLRSVPAHAGSVRFGSVRRVRRGTSGRVAGGARAESVGYGQPSGDGAGKTPEVGDWHGGPVTFDDAWGLLVDGKVAPDGAATRVAVDTPILRQGGDDQEPSAARDERAVGVGRGEREPVTPVMDRQSNSAG